MRISGRSRLIVSAALLFLALSGCWHQDRSQIRVSPTDMRDLLIDTSVFPQGWYMDLLPHPFISPGREEASLAVQLRREGFNALSHHDLAWFQSARKAAVEFRRQQREQFFDAGRLTPWKTPEGLNYESPVADQFRFACADFRGVWPFKLCQAMGQYGEYLSVFSTWVSPEYMTLEDVERILRAIDERMAKGLGKPLPGNSTATPAVR